MYLMDSITEAASWIIKGSGSPFYPVVSIYPEMAERLQGTPRFLLDNNTVHTAVELTLGRPKVLLEAMSYVRIPYPKMWIEWSEEGRANLRAKFPERDRYETPTRPLPLRVGFFIDSDNGRSGEVTWAWQSPFSIGDQFNPPNVGIVSAYFDLDNPTTQQEDRIKALLRGNLAHLWKDNPVQLASLFKIWETANHVPSEWGKKYLKANPGQDLGDCYADVFGEYIMIWGVMMLLTASRPIVSYTEVDNSRLNKARAKRREVPRLDHTKVTLHLDPTNHQHQLRVPLGYNRKSPRIHMVSRYLARRGNKHWIVEPYWRGKGETISRHVTVKS